MNHAAFPDFTPDEGVLDCCNARCSALLAATQIGR